MFVSTTLCATRGRPLPNWIERSVRESRVNFMSRHQVAPNPSPFLAMSISGRARTPSCVAQVACSGDGSIPPLKTGKVIIVRKPLERPIGRSFENCVAVVPSGSQNVNNQMFVMILQKISRSKSQSRREKVTFDHHDEGPASCYMTFGSISWSLVHVRTLPKSFQNCSLHLQGKW